MNHKKKLTQFSWAGINQRGLRIKGKLLGIDQEAIFLELKQQNIKPFKISKSKKILSTMFDRITGKDAVLISRQLATLIIAGIPLSKSLEIIAKTQTKKITQSLIQEINNDVACGKHFYASLAKQQLYNEIYIQLVKLGEQSGTLGVMLTRVAEYSEKSYALKKRIKKAMFYPAIVLISSFVVAFLLLVYIIPRFEYLFNSFNAKLPWFTYQTIYIAKFFQKNWCTAVTWLGLCLCVTKIFFRRVKKLTRKIDYFLLKIPILGNIFKLSIITRLIRNLATLISAGIPLLEALTLISNIAKNHLYVNALSQIIESIKEGQQMHVALRATAMFPNLVIQMIAVGEESGTLPLLLEKVACHLEEEFENVITRFSSLIEPIMILLLGSIIGSFVLAMYLPIFKLGEVI